MDELYKNLIKVKGEKWTNELLNKLNNALKSNPTKVAQMLETASKFL